MSSYYGNFVTSFEFLNSNPICPPFKGLYRDSKLEKTFTPSGGRSRSLGTNRKARHASAFGKVLGFEGSGFGVQGFRVKGCSPWLGCEGPPRLSSPT